MGYNMYICFRYDSMDHKIHVMLTDVTQYIVFRIALIQWKYMYGKMMLQRMHTSINNLFSSMKFQSNKYIVWILILNNMNAEQMYI